MDSLSDELIELLAKATHSEGFSTSLNELLKKLNITKSEFILDDIENIKRRLEELKLEISPALSTGDLNSERILRSKHRPKYDESFARVEIANIESKDLEFKSSMMFDHKKFKHSSSFSLQEYRSEGVIHSFVKTIAAFFNTSGGILYIGVDDDGNFIGLDQDCRLLGCKEFDADKWELAFREFVATRFKEGNSINDYIDLVFIKVGAVTVARIQVPKRKKLTFVVDKEKDKEKKKNETLLYRRQGNKTNSVEIDEVEEFLAIRNSST